ncbi:hypothetical protein TNCT_690521 [Trichonephila clavata]|uniref:Uncharacterized protein n=1 Tax=Trichonephila clavata TaxID=2740835 RepID=A0A8X6G8E8_TRICU|nr:hypothetical protein TNCT_690521 [Trichonephila clavata]
MQGNNTEIISADHPIEIPASESEEPDYGILEPLPEMGRKRPKVRFRPGPRPRQKPNCQRKDQSCIFNQEPHYPRLENGSNVIMGIANKLLKIPMNFAVVGTFRKNKQEIPPELFELRSRDVGTFMYCFDQAI